MSTKKACQNEHLDCAKFLIEKTAACVNQLRKGDWYLYFVAILNENRASRPVRQNPVSYKINSKCL